MIRDSEGRKPITAAEAAAPQALYRFFNADGDLLYVGISLTPVTRLQDHRSDKPWWTQVVNVTIEHHADRRAVMAAEKRAIIAERPKYNITHNVSRGARRMATMLARMTDAPDVYRGTCDQCEASVLPTELVPDQDGWSGTYDHCGATWTWSW